MTQFRVTAPAADFTGAVLAVPFKDGVAIVDESATVALAYFRRKGYTVEPVDAAEPVEDEPATGEDDAEPVEDEPAKPARSRGGARTR